MRITIQDSVTIHEKERFLNTVVFASLIHNCSSAAQLLCKTSPRETRGRCLATNFSRNCCIALCDGPHKPPEPLRCLSRITSLVMWEKINSVRNRAIARTRGFERSIQKIGDFRRRQQPSVIKTPSGQVPVKPPVILVAMWPFPPFERGG